MAKRHWWSLAAAMIIGSLLAGSPASGAKAKERKQSAPDTAQADAASRTGIISKDPYLGAIVIDSRTGKVLFEDNPDAKGYPASITKLMVLLIYLDGIQTKRVGLQDPITITAEVARIGGSQVYLKENEVFPVENLLYATIVQSANDAATALALHYAGSKGAFVDVMNQWAQKIGMKDTIFYSVHGLPPGKDQLPDVSTPRDLARLSQELLKYPDTIKYTATRERSFREDAKEPFIMRSHNHLLDRMEGCDGLKTGYFVKAGFSIAATAVRQEARAIAVVLGSTNRKVRDAKARELLSKGLMQLAAQKPAVSPQPSVQVTKAGADARPEGKVKTEPQEKKSDLVQIQKSTLWWIMAVLIVGGLVAVGLRYIVKIPGPKNRDEYVG